MARFDDRLRNLLALARDKSPANRIALYRHLGDLLLQGRPLGDDDDRRMLLEILDQLRGDVPLAVRREMAEATIANPFHPPELVRTLAVDDLAVARPVLDSAILDERDWLDLIAEMPADNRAHLRIRSDLAPAARRALREKPAVEPEVPETSETHVRRLLDRLATVSRAHEVEPPQAPPPEISATEAIEDERAAEETPAAEEEETAPPAIEPRPAARARRWEAVDAPSALFVPDRMAADSTRDAKRPPPPRAQASHREPGPNPGAVGAAWLWETDRIGRVTAVSAQMAAGIGRNVVGRFFQDLFEHDDAGLEAILSRMTSRRSFRDVEAAARVEFGGAPWAVSGVAVFDVASGLLTGYRGTARPAEEVVRPPAWTPRPSAPPQPAFDAAQWAHEMRTPLNAIKGFAEMIETEAWGGVAPSYRERSSRIRAAAARADRVIGDLLAVAKFEDARLSPPKEEVDLAATVERLIREIETEREAKIQLRRADPVPRALGEPTLIERIADKILRTGVNWTRPQERLAASLGPDIEDGVKFAVAAPLWREGWSDRALKEIGAVIEKDPPTLGPPGPHSASLGLDLAAKLVQRVGGRLNLEPDSAGKTQIVLRLPRFYP